MEVTMKPDHLRKYSRDFHRDLVAVYIVFRKIFQIIDLGQC